MEWEIVILILCGIIYIGGAYLFHKYRNKKYTNLVAITISVLLLIFTITQIAYYDDYSTSNTLSIILCLFPIVIYIGSMIYKRFKQKEE